MEYASKGVAGAGLGLGIAGTALGILNGGGVLANMMGVTGSGAGANNQYVTKDELAMAQQLAAKDSQIALLQSEQNTEVKIADVYERIMTRVNSDQREQAAWNAQQMVNNAQISAAVAANATSIAGLQACCSSITKTVIPNSSVCPGWGQVVVTPTGSGTTVG